MNDSAVELGIIKSLLTDNCPIVGFPVDLARDEKGHWSIITYSHDLEQHTVEDQTRFFVWLNGVGNRLYREFNINGQIVRKAS